MIIANDNTIYLQYVYTKSHLQKQLIHIRYVFVIDCNDIKDLSQKYYIS